MSEVVRRVAPDVVAFQEFDQLHLDWLEHALPEYAGLAGLPGDTTEQPTFNAIAWGRGWRLCSSGGWYLNEDGRPWVRGWDASYVRTANWAHLVHHHDGPGTLVVNTHLDNVGERARIESTRRLVRLVDEQNVHRLPVVLMGDFNAGSGDALYGLLAAAGFSDALHATGRPDDGVATYHGYEGLRHDPAEHGGRLDRILTRDLQATSYEHITLARPPGYPSDHWPVVADLVPARASS